MSLTFRLLPGHYAVCRLDPSEALFAMPRGEEFVSITRTARELSLVVPDSNIPRGSRAEREWRILELAGPIPFDQTGVASSFTSALAEKGISVFVISTFDTDYVLVKEPTLERAIAALEAKGMRVG